MTRHQQARAWRERNHWTRVQLADMTGLSTETIFWMEKGVAPPSKRGDGSREIKPWVWRRYMLVCAGVESEKQGAFKW